jgi:predicted metal-dependent peptidase
MTDNEAEVRFGLQRETETGRDHDDRAQIAQTWANIAQRVQVAMETFGKQRGTNPGGMLQNLNAVNREKYDYTAFLQKFAVLGETMKVNDDEFDYIFYTYGLQLYKNMPLIEPLEYKEVRRIKEFVIAIDTSGSTSGKLVQKFVQKTYNILKSTESFFAKINLHIIQCDAEIQEDVKITCQKEFDDYLKNMQIHGLGGTDFRPVFTYVEELRRAKEFVNLKGLIYFTDGYGEFPRQKPDYDTAFVFVDNEYHNPDVPSWTIKLVLQEDEI